MSVGLKALSDVPFRGFVGQAEAHVGEFLAEVGEAQRQIAAGVAGGEEYGIMRAKAEHRLAEQQRPKLSGKDCG